MIRGLLTLVLLTSLGCDEDDDLPWVSLEPPLSAAVPDERGPEPLRVGVAPVFSAVSSFEHYNPLVELLGATLGQPAAYIQRGTYHEINELTRHGAVDLAFTCSGPWLLDGEGLELLVVPLIDGDPYYQAVCLTGKDQQATGFMDLAGARFGFTDTLSFTGRLYTEARLAQLETTAEAHFGKVVQVEGHDVLLHMLAHGDLDGGCVNSVVFDQFSADHPALGERLQVFERSEPFGAPPVVASQRQDPALRARLVDALLGLHETDKGRPLLEALGVDRFVEPPEGLYDSARELVASHDPGGRP